MENNFIKKLLVFDWIWFATWIITSNCDKPLKQLVVAYDAELDERMDVESVVKSRNVDLLYEESKGLHEETLKGLKEINERADKTLALILVALGWNATTIRSISGFCFLFAAACLLLIGRIFMESVNPISFKGLLRSESFVNSLSAPEARLKLAIARQYEMARFQNDFIATWAQRRLLFSAIFLVIGLIVLTVC